MLKRLIVAAAAVAVLATTAVAVATPPPTTSTTTTTLPPAPPQLTRGTVACPEGSNRSDWSSWVQMGEHTRIIINTSIEGAGYPVSEMEFSTDGQSPLGTGFGVPPGDASLWFPQEVRTAWPYFRIRCNNGYSGTPDIAWKLIA